MRKRHLTTPLRLLAAVTALLLALAACGGGGDSAGGDAGGGGGGGAEDKNVNFGVIQGWTDQTATTALLQVILEENGYTTKTTDMSDNALMYTGLAKGDIDVLSSAWIERTHVSFWERYGKDIADLGTYYDNARNYLAVPDYSNINSIEELPQHAAEFGNRVVGIEPGAGLTKQTQENVMGGSYGLEGSGYKLVLSSTAAMLTELKKATEAKQPIVVTLWAPFWANQSFPVKPLEDPKKAYGDPEKIHVVANKEYAGGHAQLGNMLANFKLTEEEFGTLEDTVVNKFPKGQEKEAAKAWLAEHPGYADSLAASLQG
jgi:glycine betaine/proline transport system substrate-binding protein